MLMIWFGVAKILDYYYVEMPIQTSVIKNEDIEYNVIVYDNKHV